MEDEIKQAIEYWKSAAMRENTLYAKNLYLRTARALEIELETGFSVCVCCLKVKHDYET